MAEDDLKLSPRSGKSGMAFDVVLEPAQREAPTGVKLSPRGEKQPVSQEEIERKLREAEDRREKLERERLDKLKIENDDRIEKVRERLNAGETEQANKQKAELDQSLENSAERREAFMREKQEKAKAREEHAKQVRNRKSQRSEDSSQNCACDDGAAAETGQV